MAAPALPQPSLVPCNGRMVRRGHEVFVGTPTRIEEVPPRLLLRLAGRFIACPGCTQEQYDAGHCHTAGIVRAFRTAFPELPPPRFLSGATKVVEGRGGIRDVYVAHDAVFCGCYPPRGSPHLRALGFSLPATVLGNPAKVRKSRSARAEP